MTAFLVKLFIKNADDTSNADVRGKYGKLSGIVGIICNIFLCAAKLIIGMLSSSVSITADAVNNLSDASSSVVTLLGFKLAAKPADDKHPYGYRRIEYFSGLIVAVLILLIGFELIKTSFMKIIHPTEIEFSIVMTVVLALSILVKLWMSLFYSKLGKIINSSTLEASAQDSKNDVISTFAVLVACIISELTGLKIDGYIGIIVALFILWSGIEIAGKTISPLLGEAPDEELVHALGERILKNEKVLGIHDLIMHDYGPGRRFASVHAEMNYRDDVMESHECIDDIEREIMQEMNIELVIHYDPIVTDDDEVNDMKKRVLEKVKEIDERMSLHDFRMVKGNTHTNVIFDLVIPKDLESKKDSIVDSINENIQFGDKKYYAVITFDEEFFNDPHTRK